MSSIKMANVLCKIRCGTWKLLLRIYEPFKVHEHSDHLWSEILYFLMIKFGCLFLLGKLLLVHFYVVEWVLFSFFSIFCMTLFGDYTPSATPRNYSMFFIHSRLTPTRAAAKEIIYITCKEQKIAHVTNFNKLFQLLKLTFHSIRPFL